VNRRELIALGLGSLLAACRQLRDPLTPEQRAAADATEAGEPLGPIEKRLSIYNWSDYVAPDTRADREAAQYLQLVGLRGARHHLEFRERVRGEGHI
jgi:hypothetical protein